MIGSDIDRALELSKCAHDFVYFCETYLKVLHHAKGILPLHLHPFQKRYIQVINSNKRFVIGKKFRQGGFTTVGLAWMLWKALFCIQQDGKPWSGLYLSKTDRDSIHASEIIDKMLDLFPSWMQEEIKVEKQNDHHIKFSDRGQVKFRSVATTRGMSADFAFVDESAFIKDMENHWKSIYPAISTNGKALVMSSVNGAEGWFYDTYQAAERNQNEFYVFYSYYTEYPEYRDPNWVSCTKKNLGPKAFRQEVLCQFVDKADLDKKWMNAADFACEVTATEETDFWDDIQEKREERNRRVKQIKELAESNKQVFSQANADLVKDLFGEEEAEQFGTLIHEDEQEYTLENDPEYKGPYLKKKNIDELKEFISAFDNPDHPDAKIHEEMKCDRQADQNRSFMVDGIEYKTLDAFLGAIKKNNQADPLPSNRKNATHYKDDVVYENSKVEQMTWGQIHSRFKKEHRHWHPNGDKHPMFDTQKTPRYYEEFIDYAEMCAEITGDYSWVCDLKKRNKESKAYFKGIEDRVNYLYYSPNLMALCGLESDGEEYSVRPEIEIINTIAEDQELPEDLELMFLDGHLCIKGVPTNILERDCMDLYNGTLTLKSAHEAKAEIVSVIRKKLKVLFGKDLEHEYEFKE